MAATSAWLTDLIRMPTGAEWIWGGMVPDAMPQLTLLTASSPGMPNPREVLIGGGTGAGKTTGVGYRATQYVDLPQYRVLVLRRVMQGHYQSGGLIPLLRKWYEGTAVRWVGAPHHTFTFPSGATIQFGSIEDRQAAEKYDGGEYHCIIFDELPHFEQFMWDYIVGNRLRRKAGDPIPLQAIGTGNPGGIGNDWVMHRFGMYVPHGDPDQTWLCKRPGWGMAQGDGLGRVYIEALARHNPHLDYETYERQQKALLSPVELARKLYGDWTVRAEARMFDRQTLLAGIVDRAPGRCRWVRAWDLAATQPHSRNRDPDWTVGARVGLSPTGELYVEDISRLRAGPADVEAAMTAAADRDGTPTTILIEEEKGSAGKHNVSHYRRTVLPDRVVEGVPPNGSKEERANVLSSKAANGLLHLVRGPWNSEFVDEAESFPGGQHDDQIDAVVMAANYLLGKRKQIVVVNDEPAVKAAAPTDLAAALAAVGHSGAGQATTIPKWT